jgi:hypothetical protein
MVASSLCKLSFLFLRVSELRNEWRLRRRATKSGYCHEENPCLNGNGFEIQTKRQIVCCSEAMYPHLFPKDMREPSTMTRICSGHLGFDWMSTMRSQTGHKFTLISALNVLASLYFQTLARCQHRNGKELLAPFAQNILQEEAASMSSLSFTKQSLRGAGRFRELLRNLVPFLGRRCQVTRCSGWSEKLSALGYCGCGQSGRLWKKPGRKGSGKKKLLRNQCPIEFEFPAIVEGVTRA